MKLRNVLLSLIALCLAALPASAQTLYSNGPIDGQDFAWTINFGFAISDTFTLANASTVTGLSFGDWTVLGDVLSSVEVQITSSEFGGTTYTDQIVSLTESGCFTNHFGFNVCAASGSFGTAVDLSAGTYWLSLDNACCTQGDPIYWDQNSGPSSASQSSAGTIPSESFTILGTTSGTGTVPEPTSIVLLASGLLGVTGILRHKRS